MNTGNIQDLIKHRLYGIFLDNVNVKAAFGFGSFFRSTKYNDIDVVVVLQCTRKHQLCVYEALLGCCAKLELEFGVAIDLTPLTQNEFAENPLREMNTLTPIFNREIF